MKATFKDLKAKKCITLTRKWRNKSIGGRKDILEIKKLF
jgi:hypothetical protein